MPWHTNSIFIKFSNSIPCVIIPCYAKKAKFTKLFDYK